MKATAQRLLAGCLMIGLCTLQGTAFADDMAPAAAPVLPKAVAKAPAKAPIKAAAKHAKTGTSDASSAPAAAIKPAAKPKQTRTVSPQTPDGQTAASDPAAAKTKPAKPASKTASKTALPKPSSAKVATPASSPDSAQTAASTPKPDPSTVKPAAKKLAKAAKPAGHISGFAATDLPLPAPASMDLAYDAPLALPASMMTSIPQPPARPNGSVLGDSGDQNSNNTEVALAPAPTARTITAPATFSSPSTFSAPTSKGDVNALIVKHAARYAMPEALLRRIVARESGGNPTVRNGPYMGLMQMRLETARGMGYHGTAAGLLDANTNLTYGAAYLANAYKVAGGNLDRAVQLYAGGYYYEAKRKGLLPKLIKSAPSQ